jgi:hypothetical protein
MSAFVEIDTGHSRSLGELVETIARTLGLGGAQAAPPRH